MVYSNYCETNSDYVPFKTLSGETFYSSLRIAEISKTIRDEQIEEQKKGKLENLD